MTEERSTKTYGAGKSEGTAPSKERDGKAFTARRTFVHDNSSEAHPLPGDIVSSRSQGGPLYSTASVKSGPAVETWLGLTQIQPSNSQS